MPDRQDNQNEIGAPDAIVVGAPDSPSLRPIPHLQETARRRLTFFLVGILAAEVFAALTLTWLPTEIGLKDVSIADLREIMEIVFGPTVALVGSAAGFYFGTRS